MKTVIHNKNTDTTWDYKGHYKTNIQGVSGYIFTDFDKVYFAYSVLDQMHIDEITYMSAVTYNTD